VRLVIGAAGTMLISAIMQNNTNFAIPQVETILRGFVIVLVVIIWQYFFFEIPIWVNQRHAFIRRLGHIEGIIAHSMLGQAFWAMGLALVVSMWDINNPNAFPTMLGLATVIAIGQSFIKMEKLKGCYREGIAIDLIGVPIAKNSNLIFWNGVEFVNVQGKWCMSNTLNGKIEFRINPKDDLQIAELWKFRVIGQK